MKCSLCGFEFNEETAQSACCGCPLTKGNCGLTKCPNCGFEMVQEPEWIKKLKNRKAKKDDINRKG